MEISSLQILAIFIVSAVAGMGSVLDELQTHRPLIACTFTGLILGDMTTGIIIGGTLEMIASLKRQSILSIAIRRAW